MGLPVAYCCLQLRCVRFGFVGLEQQPAVERLLRFVPLKTL